MSSMSPIYSGTAASKRTPSSSSSAPHMRRRQQQHGPRSRLACLGLSALLFSILGGVVVLLWWNISYKESIDFMARFRMGAASGSSTTEAARRQQFESSFNERHLRRRAIPIEGGSTESIEHARGAVVARVPVEPDFACLDGSGSGRAVLNDDFCDCADGSDEPETSACSDRLVGRAAFRCKGSDGRVIFASRVQDGVADCPQRDDEQYDLLGEEGEGYVQ